MTDIPPSTTAPRKGTVFDTLDSLLINTSPGAIKAVNERLAERLMRLGAARRWVGEEEVGEEEGKGADEADVGERQRWIGEEGVFR